LWHGKSKDKARTRADYSLPHFERRLAVMKFHLNVYPFGLGRKKKTNHTLFKVLAGAGLAAVGAGIIASLPDIKRYIRISTM